MPANGDTLHLLQLGLVLLVLMVGAIARYRTRPFPFLKPLLVWCVILFAGVTLYAYRGIFLGNPVIAEFLPYDRGVSLTSGEVQFRKAQDGHFYVRTDIEGVTITFLVDTGASKVSLTKDDASRLGINVDELSFNQLTSTANGMGRSASIRLPFMTVNGHTVRDIRASVNEGEMSTSLLGMSFLEKLRGYRIEENTLTFVF